MKELLFGLVIFTVFFGGMLYVLKYDLLKMWHDVRMHTSHSYAVRWRLIQSLLKLREASNRLGNNISIFRQHDMVPEHFEASRQYKTVTNKIKLLESILNQE